MTQIIIVIIIVIIVVVIIIIMNSYSISNNIINYDNSIKLITM
jgi:hypothetical protein